MSNERILLDYLNDILESITDIKEFTDGMTIESFSMRFCFNRHILDGHQYPMTLGFATLLNMILF